MGRMYRGGVHGGGKFAHAVLRLLPEGLLHDFSDGAQVVSLGHKVH